MAIKFGYMPKEKFTKIDNNVSRIKTLSDSSIRYYVFVAGLPNGKNITDEYVAKAIDWSVSKVKRAKNELRKYDLVLTDSLHRGLHYIYIGNTKIGASTVKKYVSDNELDSMTLEDVEFNHKRTRDIVDKISSDLIEEALSNLI